MDTGIQFTWLRNIISGSYGKSMFCFIRNCWIVFQSGCTTLHFHQQRMREFLLLHILTSICCCQVLDFGHFGHRCGVVPHCFNLQFLNDIWYWISFHILAWHLYNFLGKWSVHAFCLFLKSRWLFSNCWVLIVLCLFWMIVLYQMCFRKYFLPVCGLSSHSLDIVFHSSLYFLIL